MFAYAVASTSLPPSNLIMTTSGNSSCLPVGAVHAKEKVNESVGFKEEGAMASGVVAVAVTGVQLPGPVGVPALIVANRPRSQVPEAGGYSHSDKNDIESCFPVQIEKIRNRSIEEATFLR